MLLSERNEYNGMIFGLIKFTDYIDDLRSGNLYMNNFKYFIDLEKKSGIKGVGDKLEASHVFSDMEFKMYDSKTNELVLEGQSSSFNFNLDEDTKKPVYCMFAIDSQILEIIKEDEDFIYTKYSMPQEQIDKLVKEFGNKMVFINPVPFIERITTAFKGKNYSYKADKVKYDDYTINNAKRLKMYKEQGNNEIFFWKDKYFENQNEYRIVITDLEGDGPVIENIGNIEDITTVLEIRDFFSDKYEYRIKK